MPYEYYRYTKHEYRKAVVLSFIAGAVSAIGLLIILAIGTQL